MPVSARCASRCRSRYAGRRKSVGEPHIVSASAALPPHYVDQETLLDAFRAQWAEKRSEEHTSELQSRFDLVCRLLLEKKKKSGSGMLVQSFQNLRILDTNDVMITVVTR